MTIAVCVMVLILTFLCGCKATKKSSSLKEAEQVAVVKMDSVERAAVETHKKDSATGYATEEWTEEQTGVAGESTDVAIDLNTVQPGLDTTIKNTRSSVTVKVGANNKMKITCKADSLLQIIRKYRRDSMWQAHRMDSVTDSYWHVSRKSDSVAVSSSVREQTERKVGGKLWTGFKWFLIGVLIGYCVRWYHKL
jgi:hypothetical protein